MADKNKMEVRIGGKEYTLVGTESDEYMQKVGFYIDRKMTEIMRINNRLSTSMVAVLTAINVADDYWKASESEKNQKIELDQLRDVIEKQNEENRVLTIENSSLKNKNTNLQLDLAKREAELKEVRSSIEKTNLKK